MRGGVGSRGVEKLGETETVVRTSGFILNA